jgi:hypothetical protein
MKAYMSEIRHINRLSWHSGRGMIDLEGMAIAEAERILADTQWSTSANVHFPALCMLSHNERAALAEGLAFAITALEEMS